MYRDGNGVGLNEIKVQEEFSCWVLPADIEACTWLTLPAHCRSRFALLRFVYLRPGVRTCGIVEFLPAVGIESVSSRWPLPG